MSADISRLIKVLAEICEEKELKAAVSESLKGGIVAGTGAVLGGLILGPLGLALGGAIGGAVAAVSSHGEFKPVAEILIKMPPKQRQLLYQKLKAAFCQFGCHDIIGLTMLIISTPGFKSLACKVVTSFLAEEMKMSVMS